MNDDHSGTRQNAPDSTITDQLDPNPSRAKKHAEAVALWAQKYLPLPDQLPGAEVKAKAEPHLPIWKRRSRADIEAKKPRRQPGKPKGVGHFRSRRYVPPVFDELNGLSDPSAQHFCDLRTLVLRITRKQCGQLLRVSDECIRNWEKGKTRLPFPAYLALWLLTQSEKFRFLSEQWREWKFEIGCNHKGRGISYLKNEERKLAFEPHELAQYYEAMSSNTAAHSTNEQLRTALARLTKENTELRQLFTANGITDEIEGMQLRLAELLDRIRTAKVIPFPDKDEHSSGDRHAKDDAAVLPRRAGQGR